MTSPQTDAAVIDWLLQSDPAIRWQVMRDLTGAPETEVSAERARVTREGWGARLLQLQRDDGHWDSSPPEFDSERAERWWHGLPAGCRGTLFPEWTSTAWSLALLRQFGLDPGGDEARRAVARVHDHCLWEHDAEPFFAGEVEPCINGRAVALGAYFGIDMAPVVERLLGEQMEDGGWNCEQENGSTRGSFDTTINVLEGLLEHECATGGSAEVEAARHRGHEYLLERRLLRRLSSGEVIREDYLRFANPNYWHYDVLRGLEYLRDAAVPRDARMDEAIALVDSKRDGDGRWRMENVHEGGLHFPLDEGLGRPSRWITLRALRVLDWFG